MINCSRGRLLLWGASCSEGLLLLLLLAQCLVASSCSARWLMGL